MGSRLGQPPSCGQQYTEALTLEFVWNRVWLPRSSEADFPPLLPSSLGGNHSSSRHLTVILQDARADEPEARYPRGRTRAGITDSRDVVFNSETYGAVIHWPTSTLCSLSFFLRKEENASFLVVLWFFLLFFPPILPFSLVNQWPSVDSIFCRLSLVFVFTHFLYLCLLMLWSASTLVCVYIRGYLSGCHWVVWIFPFWTPHAELDSSMFKCPLTLSHRKAFYLKKNFKSNIQLFK